MENPAAPVFKVEKKFSWKTKIIKWFEVLLIGLVGLGTVFWLLSSSRTSFNSFFSKTLGSLKPKVSIESTQTEVTPEEEIRTLLTGDYGIVSVNKTDDGNLEVKTSELLIIFSLDKDLGEQVRTLQTIQAKAKIDNRGLKKV